METLDLVCTHFEDYDHDGPLIISYRISDDDCCVKARAGYGMGHRVTSYINITEEIEKVSELVQSLMENFSSDNILIRSLEVFEGEII